MKIKYKLILIFIIIILAAALPLSLFILNKQQDQTISNLIHQSESNCRVLVSAITNIILMNGGDIPTVKVDSKEMISILSPLTNDGLVYAEVMLLSGNPRLNGTVLASFINREILKEKTEIEKYSSKEVNSLNDTVGFSEIEFKGVNDKCYQLVAIGAIQKGTPVCLGRLIYSKSIALEQTRKLRNLIYLITTIAIVLVSLLGLGFSRILSKPIAALTYGVERIEVGDLNFQVPVTTKDELGKLANTFNHMIQMLNMQIVELVTVNRSLTRIDKLKDEFLANMSHELRSPLNGIIGLAESLIEGSAGPMSRNASHDLSLIISSGKRLAYLVNDILDFSKLKHKDIDLNLATTDIFPVIQLVLALVNPLVNNKKITINNNIEPESVIVYGDENRLQQILLNIIGNAIKFTEEGEITIIAKDNIIHPDFIEICVSDEGIGISDETMEHIFESFEQADGSVTRSYGGTGLGLAITKKLIELHDGRIWVESELGVGSKFFFTLRKSYEEYKKKESSESKFYPGISDLSHDDMRLLRKSSVEISENSQKTIMVVDDEPVNLQVLINHLTLEGYNVVPAIHGDEVLEKLQRKEIPDLILLDVMLPRISGYEICSIIREQYSQHDLPVIMLTAKNKTEDVVTGLEVGANDYLAKPVNKKELIARVNSLINLKESIKIHNELNIIKRDIQIAHEIQNSILIEELPQSDRLNIGVAYQPMQELGGDFYDIEVADDDIVNVLLADVSGHGIPAAFICAMLKVVYTFHLIDALNPAELLTNINKTMFNYTGGQFLTACYASIDLKKMKLYQSNAGHWPLVIVRKNLDYNIVDYTSSMPIGWDSEESYENVEMDLEKGDRIIIYTDGIIEVRNEENEMFGAKRFSKLIKENEDISPENFVDKAIDTVRNWSTLEPEDSFPDDITLIVIDLS